MENQSICLIRWIRSARFIIEVRKRLSVSPDSCILICTLHETRLSYLFSSAVVARRSVRRAFLYRCEEHADLLPPDLSRSNCEGR